MRRLLAELKGSEVVRRYDGVVAGRVRHAIGGPRLVVDAVKCTCPTVDVALRAVAGLVQGAAYWPADLRSNVGGWRMRE